jgi:type I restriction enzyme S subunit
MKFPAYQKYKTSGVEWLGEVPAHWQLKRLKMAVQLTDKKVEADEENPLPYIVPVSVLTIDTFSEWGPQNWHL